MSSAARTAGSRRTISGAGSSYRGHRGHGPGQPRPAGGEALVDSPDSEITGQEIKLAPKSEDIFASGSVKLLLKARRRAVNPSVSSPAAAGDGRFRSSELRGESHRLILSEGARMWQGKQMLSGQELTLHRDTGELRGTGGVQAVFPQASKKETEKEERLEVGGESLGFHPQGPSPDVREGLLADDAERQA